MRLISRFLLLALLLIGCGLPLWPAESPAPAVPAATAQDWHTAPTVAKAAAEKQASTTAATAPEPAGFWLQAAGWAAGALGLVITLGKFVPGIGGAVAQVAGPIYDLIVPKKISDAEKRRDALANGMETVMHILQTAPPGTPVATLKQWLAVRFPAATQDVINAWLSEREREEKAKTVTITAIPASLQAEHSQS
jgi:hypothetical protein